MPRLSDLPVSAVCPGSPSRGLLIETPATSQVSRPPRLRLESWECGDALLTRATSGTQYRAEWGTAFESTRIAHTWSWELSDIVHFHVIPYRFPYAVDIEPRSRIRGAIIAKRTTRLHQFRDISNITIQHSRTVLLEVEDGQSKPRGHNPSPSVSRHLQHSNTHAISKVF